MAITASCCLKCLKLLLRVLGAAVCTMFALQAVWLFAHPNLENFWMFCHWLGQGLLGIFVGLSGLYMEFKGSFASVSKHFKKFALNRIGLSLFYFWLGCYVMGGLGDIKTPIGEEWKTVAHATGIVSWVVAVGDLLISCCSDAPAEDEQGLRDERKQPRSLAEQYGQPSTAALPDAGNPFQQQASTEDLRLGL